MNISLYLDLAWLPRPPDDFSARCRQIRTGNEAIGDAISGLAKYGLNGQQLGRLGAVIDDAITQKRNFEPLTPLTMGLVCNATTDLIRSALVATAARYGFALTCVTSEYNQVVQDALSPDSELNKSQLDFALLALDYRALPMQPVPGNEGASAEMTEAAIQLINLVSKGLKENGCKTCVLQTIARPAEALFGSLDYQVVGTWRTLCEGFNRRLADDLKKSDDLLLDVAGIAEIVGLATWHDPAIWNLAKLPFADEVLPLYADHLFRMIAAWKGRSRRCLVLDLDNTVWGGVIGDDGLDNIRIAEGDAVGEAHRSVQATALALRDRGIVLAISSKNNDEVARAPFKEHPEMLLREEHIAVFQANWQDKASNITAIADELALGMDALAFLDDNPAERGLVRAITPEVYVPEMTDDPALFSRTLLASGAFEAVLFSEEDRLRAELYQSGARRAALQKSAGDVDAYLRSLDMEIIFKPFDAAGRARIAQLISKSNQFNLTTRRYSESEVKALQEDKNIFTLQIRLKDIFGDNGMICVVVARQRDDALEIDTWLMSCRVLGRKVEAAVLAKLSSQAQAIGAKKLVGIYRPTARNKMVEKHYEKYGFFLRETLGDGTAVWELPLSSLRIENIPMRILDLSDE